MDTIALLTHENVQKLMLKFPQKTVTYDSLQLCSPSTVMPYPGIIPGWSTGMLGLDWYQCRWSPKVLLTISDPKCTGEPITQILYKISKKWLFEYLEANILHPKHPPQHFLWNWILSHCNIWISIHFPHFEAQNLVKNESHIMFFFLEINTSKRWNTKSSKRKKILHF